MKATSSRQMLSGYNPVFWKVTAQALIFLRETLSTPDFARLLLTGWPLFSLYFTLKMLHKVTIDRRGMNKVGCTVEIVAFSFAAFLVSFRCVSFPFSFYSYNIRLYTDHESQASTDKPNTSGEASNRPHVV